MQYLLNVYCEIFGTSPYGEGRASLRVRLCHMSECRIFHNIVMYKTIFVLNIIIYMCLQHSNVL